MIRTIISCLAASLIVGCGSSTSGRASSADASADSSTDSATNLDVPDGRLRLVVGSYSQPGDTALRVYDYIPAGEGEGWPEIRYRASLPVSNASYFTQSPSGILYSVSESDEAGSSVTALRPSEDGSYEVINTLPVGSGSPCYISVSPDGRYVVTANYSGATVAVFPLGPDGSLASGPRLIPFEGHGPIADRQEQSHPHCVAFTPDGRYMLVNDLGLDRIHQFEILQDSATLIDSAPTAEVVLRPGSGPRHLVFDRKGTTAYLVNELGDNVTVLRYDGKTLTPVQYIAADTLGAMGAGDIHLSPDGRHLYASLRLKNDGIVTYDVDPRTGLLTYRAHTPTLRHPRNFTLTPDGRQMLVASRDDNAVQLFTIDPQTGVPAPTPRRLEVEKPVCVKFPRPIVR